MPTRRSIQAAGTNAGAKPSGQAAASLPIGLSDDGLPYGAMLAARPGDDALVLRMSRVLEEALAWNTRLSPLLAP